MRNYMYHVQNYIHTLLFTEFQTFQVSPVFPLLSFPHSRSHPGSHVAFSHRRLLLVFSTLWHFLDPSLFFHDLILWGVLARHVVECVLSCVCLMFSHDSTGVKALRIPLRLTVLLSSYQGIKYQHDLSLFILFDIQFDPLFSYYIMAFIFVDFIVFWFFFSFLFLHTLSMPPFSGEL